MFNWGLIVMSLMFFFDLSLSGTSVGLFNLGFNGDFHEILSIKS